VSKVIYRITYPNGKVYIGHGPDRDPPVLRQRQRSPRGGRLHSRPAAELQGQRRPRRPPQTPLTRIGTVDGGNSARVGPLTPLAVRLLLKAPTLADSDPDLLLLGGVVEGVSDDVGDVSVGE
jgi:hypothetical protein